MELLLLEDETLKITLTPEETVRYRLRAQDKCSTGKSVVIDGACEEDTATEVGLPPVQRAALRVLLEDAGKRAGIDLVERPIRVRMYAGVLGGCEIYVSYADGRALPSDFEQNEPDVLCRTCSAKNALMLRLSLRHIGFSGKTALYLDPTQGACFLRIQGDYPPILEEFGQVLSLGGEQALPWLREHCTYLPEEERTE